ncbi:TPA: hypothetical protein NHP64_000791 [Pseudomonas aeruginosa]|nr:hypothetical protein [Pseudomonas aeruginosa]
MSKELNKAPVEQAGGDERVIGWRERILAAHPNSDPGFWPDALLVEHMAAEIADLRAALAQPSPKCATCNDSGQIVVSGPHYQGEFQPPEYETEPCDMCAQPSPAQAEQAEAERPEVVARVVHSNPVVLGQCGPLNANDELMTVAQHAASVARWAEMFNRVEQERDAANARLHEVATACATAEQERDAALAEVERLRESKGDPSGSFDRCMKMMYERDENAKRLDAALARVAELESKLAELEKQEPIGCRMSRSALTEAQMRRLYENSTDIENERLGFAAFARLMRRAEAVHQIAAAPSQAQHSVPEGWMLVECGIWTQEQVDEMQKTVARFRNSEFVDDRALAMAVADAGQCKAPEISLAELLAAAPGKEGL